MSKHYKIIEPLRVNGRHLMPGCPNDPLEELDEKQIQRLEDRGAIKPGKAPPKAPAKPPAQVPATKKPDQK